MLAIACCNCKSACRLLLLLCRVLSNVGRKPSRHMFCRTHGALVLAMACCNSSVATLLLLLLLLHVCRVLTQMGRKPLRPTSQLENSTSRSSTAASLLSLKQQPTSGHSPSRPGTDVSSGSRMAGSAAATAGGRSDGGDGRFESGMGGVSTVGAAFNRTLLLEMVQQDDVSEGCRVVWCGVLLHMQSVWVRQIPADAQKVMQQHHKCTASSRLKAQAVGQTGQCVQKQHVAICASEGHSQLHMQCQTHAHVSTCDCLAVAVLLLLRCRRSVWVCL